MFGTIRTSARPATGDEICLIRAASASTAASRSSGPSTMPPTICPPVRHLGQDRPVERGRHFGPHCFHRRQHGHFRQLDAERAREADRVLADVALLIGVRCDVQRDVAEDEAARIGRHRHHRAVADQPPGAEFRFLLHDRVQQHVGVQAALHQCLRPRRRRRPSAAFSAESSGSSVATMRHLAMSRCAGLRSAGSRPRARKGSAGSAQPRRPPRRRPAHRRCTDAPRRSASA